MKSLSPTIEPKVNKKNLVDKHKDYKDNERMKECKSRVKSKPQN